MASTSMWSPPTSWASAAMSVVDVMTLSFLAKASEDENSNTIASKAMFLRLKLRKALCIPVLHEESMHHQGHQGARRTVPILFRVHSCLAWRIISVYRIRTDGRRERPKRR